MFPAGINHARSLRHAPSRLLTALLLASAALVLSALLPATAAFPLVAGPAGAQVSDAGTSPSAQVSGPVTSANARYLAASYSELLGRSADTGGLDFHLRPLASGGSANRQVVAYGMLFSPEGSRREVDRAYADILHRAPDPVGAQYWTNHLSGRGVLDLRVLLLASDEFRLRAGGSNAAWLDGVYDVVLDRLPETAGRSYWLGLLNRGLPRALITGAIYQSDEALGRRADAYFSDVLGRAPSSAERAGAIQSVRRHGERYLRARLWASDEAFEQFLQGAWS